ncbi:hypothetical protein T05_3834 [Trichinella murrelli]|uniref:Uncharacterized protein n=1 Tax=Trichinella murrelli TaxID=144512 RepID=A0A0V0TKU9_9BILA|nr:hypothetical protein T05_16398 [Trichinella murrelli]KRX39661.1 hypothetical protein T05_3834 [Trichinella murrelli]
MKRHWVTSLHELQLRAPSEETSYSLDVNVMLSWIKCAHLHCVHCIQLQSGANSTLTDSMKRSHIPVI